MIARLLSVGLIVAFATAAQPAEGDNPFKDAREGDHVVYKVSLSIAGKRQDGKIKMSVKDRKEKDQTVTLSTTVEMSGRPPSTTDAYLDLSKPYDPLTLAGINPGEVKVEKLDSGKEKIKVGGKEYDTEWERSKVTMKLGGNDFVTEVKSWRAKNVPLGGCVKLEMTNDLYTLTMELSETNR
jgi:hypothetical protein